MLPRNSFSFSLCLLLVVVLFHLCISNRNPDDVLCMDVEKHALLEFKHGLIDETDRLASWVDDGESNCCKWAGIVCDNVTRHVHQIHLRALDGRCDYYYDYDYESERRSTLRGDVSPSLLHLKQLRHLDLSCNDFEGIQIPSFIGSLRNLRYLNLSRSKFGGIIPPQLGNLSDLNVLALGGNFDYIELRCSLMNMQWLSSLRVLHHLDMRLVDLSEATDWFQVINIIPSLVQLHLSFCELVNIHPYVPSLNLTSLTLLDLSNNDFSSYVPRWIFSITSLVSLDLSGCFFHGHVPSSIDSFRNMTSIELLHVSRNDFMNSPLVLEGLSSTIASNLVSLAISDCGVSSSVLESLHNLTSLLSLDLSDNQLTKSIPKSLGNLCNLRDLYLSYNDFSNITLTYLLESFSYCKSSRLESLSLHSTNITGHLSDQLGQLTLLKYLQLSHNLISGPIPFSIGRLSSLEMLDLSYNCVNGSIPDSIGQLSNLERLDFSYNLLTGVVKEAHFEKLVKLKSLNGKYNNLTLRPQGPNWIPPFDLETLYLNSWTLGPQFPLWLQLQKNLIEIDISNTCISEYMPKWFWRSFTKLEYLDMSRNRIQGTLWSIPETLQSLNLSSKEFSGNLTQLSNGSLPIYLDLSNNFFVGSLYHLLCSNGVKATQVLNLGNNHLSGIIPECWENWPGLISLNLANNNLSGEIPRTLGSLSYLLSLSMSRNKILGRLPSSLMNLTNLEILQLGRNGLVGSIPSWLGRELSFLRLLNLRSNNFDGIIPHELCYLKTIQILDLADNNLSGNIPKCFNNFSVLSGKENISERAFSFYMVYGGTTIASDLLVMKGREDTYSTILELVMLLDLSSNNLVGHIPSEISELVSLKSLNLSRNQLTGRIPEKIGDLKSLETFDVSTNKLSGELPMSLSSLSFLSSFNVSYNNFTGRIPSSTQLQSLNESSFLGNNLCGAPLESCAVKVHGTKDKKEDDGSNGVDWGLIISIVVGIITGFWIVVAPLIVSRSWRIAYFYFLSKLWYKVCDVIHKYWCNMCRK